jgi:hypothetical protein
MNLISADAQCNRLRRLEKARLYAILAEGHRPAKSGAMARF